MSSKKDIDIITLVRDRLIEQGEKSMDDDLSCRYRGYKHSTIDKIQAHAEKVASDSYDPATDEYENVYFHAFNDVLVDTKYDAKCAVGHLISNSLYSTAIEGGAVDEDIFELVIQSNPEWSRGPDCYSLMKEMQNIHDNHEPAEWEKEFNDLIRLCDDDGNWIKKQGAYGYGH